VVSIPVLEYSTVVPTSIGSLLPLHYRSELLYVDSQFLIVILQISKDRLASRNTLESMPGS
jgi:hypothetical protein